MKDIVPGVYPMYQTEKILEKEVFGDNSDVKYEKRNVTICHTEEISLNDSIQYKKFDLKFKVIEVIESRKAKGNHINENVKWFNLILEYKK